MIKVFRSMTNAIYYWAAYVLFVVDTRISRLRADLYSWKLKRIERSSNRTLEKFTQLIDYMESRNEKFERLVVQQHGSV